MKRVMVALLVGVGLWLGTVTVRAADGDVNLYFFYSKSCPHCAREEKFLDGLEREDPKVEVSRFEVSGAVENAILLGEVGRELGVDTQGVPITFVGKRYVVGYGSDETTGEEIRQMIELVRLEGDPDLVGGVWRRLRGLEPVPTEAVEEPLPTEGVEEPEELLPTSEPVELEEESGSQVEQWGQEEGVEEIDLPIAGVVNVSGWSLPLLTVVIALVDGFNPCAMWVLLFLISILLGMENRVKMWSLGLAFIVTSGVVYFLFLSAWLNLFLWVGMIVWIRCLVGLFAVGAGGWQLASYFKDKEGGCKVTGSETRGRIMDRIKAVTKERHFWVAMTGMVVLAVAVNMIELVCSAGLPAIYTSVLSLSDLAAWQYYAYLGLYVLIFMLDDLVVFGVAMKTLQVVGVESKYARVTKLVGGVVILGLGVLLIVRPEWLMFG